MAVVVPHRDAEIREPVQKEVAGPSLFGLWVWVAAGAAKGLHVQTPVHG